MKTAKGFNIIFILVLLLLQTGSGPAIASDVAQTRDTPIIIDHTTKDINAVPQYWIEEAKHTLHIAYGHTSHGSQITSGMSGLVGFANGGGLGLALPEDIFAWNEGGTDGALDLDDYAMGGDVGYYPDWVNNTHTYLGDPDPETGRGQNHPDVNVIMWSWCGQASGRTTETMSTTYLIPMTALEVEYPGITFVYMTGHADGTGEEGNLHLRNQQIRDYCTANNKVLFDFYDIELYNPDGNYYGDKYVNDNCDYDPDGAEPISRTRNWATDWQGSHTQNVDWYSCSCAHSQSLNCNQKAYAIWWLWARLAGWNGVVETTVDLTPSSKSVSPAYAGLDERVTYTVNVRNATGPVYASVLMTDTLRPGLAYVPGTLTATAGIVNDSAAPTLHWSGSLSPTYDILISYTAVVTYPPAGTGTTIIAPTTMVNTAFISAPGYQSITRTATLRTHWHQVYLPLVIKQ